MNLLLDTQALIYAFDAPDQLPPATLKRMADPANLLFVSVVSPLEMQIKVNLGKLKLTASPASLLQSELDRGAFTLLPITLAHIDALSGLPDHHRDPFDRLLIAQAIHENLSIVTGDAKIAMYPVPTLWA